MIILLSVSFPLLAQNEGFKIIDSMYQHAVSKYQGRDLLHYMLDTLGRKRLRYNEAFVSKEKELKSLSYEFADDSISYALLEKLAEAYKYNNNFSESNRLSREAISVAKHSQDDYLLYKANFMLSDNFSRFSYYDSSEVYLRIALPFAERVQSEDKLPLFYVLQGLGNYYNNRGWTKLALEEYLKALEVGKSDPALKMYTIGLQINIAGSYMISENYHRAIEIYKQTVIPPDAPAYWTDYLVGSLGQLYQEISQSDSARHYAEILFSRANGNPQTLNTYYTLSANIYEDGADYASARKDGVKAVQYAKQLDNPHALGASLGTLAQIERELGNFPEANRLFGLAEKELLTAGARDQIKGIRRGQIENYLDQHSPEISSYFEEFIMLNDSIEGKEVQSALAELETKYKTRIRQDSISNLTIRSELAEQQVNSRTWQLSLAGLLAAILFGGVFYFRRLNSQLSDSNKQVQAKNQELEQAKEELEDQNHQIQTLNADLNHRTSNYLDSIKILLERQRDSALGAGLDVSVVNSLERQVLAFTKVQSKLKETLDDVNLKEYLEDFCEAVRDALAAQGRPVQFDVNIADVDVKPAFAAPLALIINELATNSMKYARREDGLLRIALDAVEVNDGELRVFYRDGGEQEGEIDQKVFSSGQGVETILGFTDQLKGRVVRYGEESYDYEVVFGLEG